MARNASGLLLLLLLVVGCQTPPPPIEPPKPPPLVVDSLPILQGATDQSSTVISILVPVSKIFTYTILLDRTRLITPTPVETINAGFDWKIVNIPLTNLAPGVQYTLKITSNGKLIDERYFRTLPKDLVSPRIAVISCTDDRFVSEQRKQWELVQRQMPDMLFMIGDNVYVDINGPDAPPSNESDIWRRYQETRLHLDLYKLKTLVPVFATWDDHDFGANNGNGNFAYKDQSKTIFHAFFPTIETKSIHTGPGVASHFELGKHHFLFLDDRTFRTEKAQAPGTHFGKAQEDWIYKILDKEKGAFWLISGDQFFGGHHKFESYEGDHPISFKNFIDRLKQKKKTVVFISGDRHIAELMKIPSRQLGYTTYELTSSALHAKVYPGSLRDIPNANAVFNKDGEMNFLILQPKEASKLKMSADAQFFGENGRSLYNTTLEIQR